MLGALDYLSALRSGRNTLVRLNDGIHAKGCPLGSLGSELVNVSEPARKQLAGSFAVWSSSIEQGLGKMRERRELAASANPQELATALLCAVQGCWRRRLARASLSEWRSTWRSTTSRGILRK